jgi:predicted TPR repeat methyltransferase
LSSQKTIESFYDERATQYVDMIKKINYSIPQWINNQYSKTKAPSVLDLACGAGNLGSILHEINPEVSIVGVDLSKKMTQVADQLNIYKSTLTIDLARKVLDNSQTRSIFAK